MTAAQEGLPVAMRQLEELLDFSDQEAREIGPINANFMADDEFVRTNREFCKHFFFFLCIKLKACRQKLTQQGAGGYIKNLLNIRPTVPSIIFANLKFRKKCVFQQKDSIRATNYSH